MKEGAMGALGYGVSGMARNAVVGAISRSVVARG